VLDEFAAVAEAKREAHLAVLQIRADVDGYLSRTGLELRETDAFLELMEQGRTLLGRLADLGQRPHVDAAAIDGFRVQVEAAFTGLGGRALELLADPHSLDSVVDSVYRPSVLADRAAEAAWVLSGTAVKVTDVEAVVRVEGLRGQHPLVTGGVLELPVGRAHTTYRVYRRHGLERFRAFNSARRATLARWREDLGLDTLRPHVLTSFVRNRLVDEVLLPMVGDNLARQLGLTAMDVARVDELRAQWREANVGADPLSVIAASLRGIESGLRDPERSGNLLVDHFDPADPDDPVDPAEPF